MHYVVLAYPDISKADYEQIRGIRKINDKQFTMVEPHFTVVFPTTKLSESKFLEHIKSIELNTKPFTFMLTKAVVEENIYPKYFQVHLVATQPISEIITLHDLLYTGALANELRKDMLYTPHITIASSKDENVMQKLADDINVKGLDIKGQVNEITISSFDDRQVVNIKRLSL